MKRLIIFLIISIVVALPVGGWSETVLQHKVVYESRHDHVFLMYESDGNDNVITQNFEHPVQLTAEEVSRIFGQLRYSKSFFFNWRGNHDVFFESELDPAHCKMPLPMNGLISLPPCRVETQLMLFLSLPTDIYLRKTGNSMWYC